MRRSLQLTVVLVGGLAAALWWIWSQAAPPPKPAIPPWKPTWVFEAPEPGGIVAAPFPDGDTVYVAAYRAAGFRLAGAVYALNAETGRARWRFDHDGDMLPTASGPVAAGGKVYAGEGMHAHFECQLYCLSADQGQLNWSVPNQDHIEASPLVEGDSLVFTGGNEGIVALDAETGQVRWRYAADVHIDSTPCRVGEFLIVGSGPSRRYKTTRVLAVTAQDGKPAWQYDTALPAWGAPTAAGNHVIIGTGNGRLTEPAKPPQTPAGNVLCLDAHTGALVWEFPTPDAVFQQVVVVDDAVYFGCRDGHVYCVGRADGKERYRKDLQAPVMASPVISGDSLYCCNEQGLLVQLDRATGKEWRRCDLAERTQTMPRILAPLRVQNGRLYVVGEFRSSPLAAGRACVYCFPDDRLTP